MERKEEDPQRKVGGKDNDCKQMVFPVYSRFSDDYVDALLDGA